MQSIYTAEKVFTGHEFLQDHAVVVKNGVVIDLLPIGWLPGNLGISHSHYIVPSFIDAQIYGARKKLFAVYPSSETLQQMYEHCLEGGTRHFLPTVATNTEEVVYQCIDAVKSYWQKGGKGVIGLHLEGPWINPLKRGAHIEELIRCPTLIDVGHLLEYGKEVIKMVTLAPEVCSREVVGLIRSYGIVISAGHSNATFAEATDAFNNGITAVTHLYNAMSAFHHRDVGLPGAAFEHRSVMASIIADGYHVDFAAVKIAKQLMRERLFLITDAVTETTKGYYPHIPFGDKYTSGGILSGSALTMLQAVKNCIKAGIDLGEAIRMASLYPAKMLGLSAGLIQVGSVADLLMLDENIELVKKS